MAIFATYLETADPHRPYHRAVANSNDSLFKPMTSNRFRVCLFVYTLVLCGCVTLTSPPQTPEPTYRYGVSWGLSGRGGAAERAPDYIHVIHRATAYARAEKLNRMSASTVEAQPTLRTTPSNAEVARWVEALVATIESAQQPGAELTRERLIWERYCRGGLGLTEDDWTFLVSAGAPENIPHDIARFCVPPK